MSDNKLSRLLGDYRSDDDENDGAESGVVKKRDNTKTDTNWTQCIDKTTGHPYYWNIVTKEVTWEVPEDYERFLRQNAIDSNRNHATNVWVLCQGDDDTEYYFNEYTRAISWDKPEDYVEPMPYTHSTSDTVHQVQTANNVNHKHWAISSVSASNGPDGRHNAEKNAAQPEKVASINLVPEYNSDNDSDEDADDDNNQQQSTAKAIDSSKAAGTNDESSKSVPFAKTMSSFASIIVGGRSPTQDVPDIPLSPTDTLTETAAIPADSMTIETERLSQKQFKRKRRIEFSFNHKRGKQMPTSNSAGADGGPVATDETSENNGNEIATVSNKGDTHSDNNRIASDTEQGDESQKTNEEIEQLQQTLLAKLQFLCQGQKEVELKSVQVMHIQLQTLIEAHTLQALHSQYLLSWLNNVSSDLMQLENEAAPAGWKCVWNKVEAKYSYENLESGCVQFEYPGESEPTQDAANDDDEMDICTTPPPPSNIDEPGNAVEFAPDPPSWSTTTKAAVIQKPKTTAEPSAPGVEVPLEDELATFYSDIASLDQSTSATSETKTQSTNDTTNEKVADAPVDGNSDTADEKKKKKRKKPKQLEPWRSGNLETWINKWQKAQKELDG